MRVVTVARIGRITLGFSIMGPPRQIYPRAVRTGHADAGVFRAGIVRFWLAAGLSVSGLLGAALIQATLAGDLPPAPRFYRFDIPAQPLAEALQAYSLTTGVQVMFETASTSGYQSKPVKGEFASDAALQMLLAGTGLKVRNTRSTAIAIASTSAPDLDAPPAHLLVPADMALDTLHVVGAAASENRDGVDEYIGVVQADLQKALKKVGRATRGEYRVGIKLWVDPTRIVQRAELFGSTGDPARDTLIVAAIRGLVLSRPAPANVPQPINFMIAITTL